MEDYSEENKNIINNNNVEKTVNAGVDMQSIYMNPSEVFSKNPVSSDSMMTASKLSSTTNLGQSDFERRKKGQSAKVKTDGVSGHHVFEILMSGVYLAIAVGIALAYMMLHFISIDISIVLTCLLTILTVTTIGRKSEGMRAFVGVYIILFSSFVAASLLMWENSTHTLRTEAIVFGFIMLISILNSFVGRKDKIQYEWIRIVFDNAYCFSLTFMLICSNEVYNVKIYGAFAGVLWLTSFINIFIMARGRKSDIKESETVIKVSWLAKNAAYIIVNGMSTYLLFSKCESGILAIALSAGYILIICILGFIINPDLGSDTYVRVLAIVILSLICGKLGLAAELFGSGILFLPLFLVYAFSKNKNAYWYVLASYVTFSIMGMQHTSLFLFEGLFMGVALMAALLIREKTVDSMKGYLLYLTFTVLLVRLFSIFFSAQGLPRIVIINIMFMACAVMFILAYIWHMLAENTGEHASRRLGNSFFMALGFILFIYGLVISFFTKNTIYLTFDTLILLAILAINITMLIKNAKSEELKNIAIIYESVICIQTVVRCWNISGTVASLICIVGVLVALIIGFTKKQKSLRQNSIILFTILMAWIMIADTNDLPTVLRGMIVIFCLIVAFTVIVIYNLLEKKYFGLGENNKGNNDNWRYVSNPVINMNANPYMQGTNTNANPYMQGANMNANPYMQGTNMNANPYMQGANMNANPYMQGTNMNVNPYMQGVNMNANPYMQGTNMNQSRFMPGNNRNTQIPSGNMYQNR